jgi:type VI secretion system secreted protein VgrG
VATYTQSNRALQVTTPLGDDKLLVTGFRGSETLSTLFLFQIDLIAENSTQVDFSKLVGKEITLKVSTPGSGSDPVWRFVDGICAAFSQGERNDRFTKFTAEVVPKAWLLTQQSQSRIFQQKSVPDILKAVLTGIDCDWKLQGHYEPREYCVQYREPDFDFASRLMEEEGIFYFFDHSESGHKMVVADTPQSHAQVPGLTTVRYGMIEGGARIADHIYEWRKIQSLRTAKYTLWDHNFQQPTQNLEAKTDITDSVQAGTVSHKLKDSSNQSLERYDFPGAYAVRFDGVSPSGGAQSSRLQKILDDKDRTVKLRMQAAAVETVQVDGKSSCTNFVAGHKFTLDRHFDADGDYVLVTVLHESSIVDGYTSGGAGEAFNYNNTFSCIPFQLPYRPAHKTPRPFVHGVQNAIVTGPGGEEIFTDKYGRVKVQFYWDRQGKKDANSSCWLRVGTTWAGKQWGFIQIPRIGQEVLVAFVEGNPDEPVIVGSVWNPETMPTYALPDNKTRSGLQTRSSMGGAAANYNEIRFEDKKGSEELYVHAEKDQNAVVEHDKTLSVGNDHTEVVQRDKSGTVHRDKMEFVDRDRSQTIHRNKSIQVDGNHTETIGRAMTVVVGSTLTENVAINYAETVGGAMELTVGAVLAVTVGAAMAETVGGAKNESVGLARSVNVGGNNTLQVGQHLNERVGGDRNVSVTKDLKETVGGQHKESVEKEFILNAKKVQIVAEDELELKVGDAVVTLSSSGDLAINGKNINVKASSDVTIKGSQIKEN